jgi:phage terminase large subunit
MKEVSFIQLAGFQPKQEEAWRAIMSPDVKYLLYGGAMHGGKSYLLRWAALGLAMWYSAKLHAEVPVGLFSEDYPTLEDRQISKMVREFPPGLGELKRTQTDGLAFVIDKKYGGGRILLRNLDDPSKYMSTEFAAILVEELTKNPYETFANLRTRLRYPGLEHVRFVGATNPGGIGHVWCKKFWLDGNSGDPEQKLFRYIPATLDDNRYTTPAYRLQLESLGERQRKAYRDGDWAAFEGQFFSTFDISKQLIEPFVIDPEWQLIGSLDPGWGGFLSFGLQARDFGGCEYRIATYYEEKRSPEEHAIAINEFIDECKFTGGRRPQLIVSGHDAWARKDRYAVIASDKTLADVFAMNELFLDRATIDRANGWGALIAAMPDQYKIFRYYNIDLVDQLTTTLTDERKPFDIQGCGNDPKVPDHALDDARYGHMALWEPQSRPAPSTDEYQSYLNNLKEEVQVDTEGDWRDAHSI